MKSIIVIIELIFLLAVSFAFAVMLPFSVAALIWLALT